ncbi:MAG: insulinase family protein [Polyangiaceae bacterium]|nr:insulinase family protein [Polyangiaceae bacterium]
MTSAPFAWPQRKLWLSAVLGTALLGASPAMAGDPPPAASAPAQQKLNIAFTKYTLPNGLTVILHEDHALPMVAVNTMVRVGSRFEEPKRTGFAHLFEHLMFMGTRRVPTKMFDAWMEAEGGSNNAWTSEDRTDYYSVGPAHILKLLLWLDADRFGSLADDMTLEKLNAQREVVRNERRQTSENEPYGKVELRLPELMYPDGHPYHHPVIGSHEDLEAAEVKDVVSFFKRHYAPNNCSLVVAGDFAPDEVKSWINTYFAGIPKVEIGSAPEAKAVKLKGVVRETIEDNVKLPKVVMAWHSPQRFAKGDAELDLLSAMMVTGKASRLYKAVVYDKPLAQEVHAEQRSADLGSQFVVEAIARPGVKLADLEKAIDREIERIRKAEVTSAELMRAQNQYEMGFFSQLQSVMRRASLLNAYETYKGDPGFIDQDIARYRNATPAAVLAAAKETLDPKARVILHVVPKAEPKVGGKK